MKENLLETNLSSTRNIMKDFITEKSVGKRRFKMDPGENKIKAARRMALFLEKNVEIPDKLPDDVLDYLYVPLQGYKFSKLVVMSETEDKEQIIARNSLFGYKITNQDKAYISTGVNESNQKYYVAVSMNDSIPKKNNGSGYYTMLNRERVSYTMINVSSLMASYIMGKWIDNLPVEKKDEVEKYLYLRRNYMLQEGFYSTGIHLFLNHPYSQLIKYIHPKVMAELLLESFEEEYYEVITNIDQIQEDASSNRSYAKKFQDKKNIPLRTLAAMENSSLLNHKSISYLELDEDVDLKEFTQVEETFHEVIKRMPVLPESVSLRFRKLGDHKAIGLYYSSFKCIAVDIRDTSAFVHEYGHAIDHQYKEILNQDVMLSMSAEFRDIRRKYGKILNQILKEDKINLNNKSYYMMPSEIFARAYEYYVALSFSDTDGTSANKGTIELAVSTQYRPFFKMENEVMEFFNYVMFEIYSTQDDEEEILIVREGVQPQVRFNI